jgi:glycosyltransferase involved in cell wall biosynthesis
MSERRELTPRASWATLLARSTWRATSALARATHGSPWRSLILPPGSRRQGLVRRALRLLLEASAAPAGRGRPIAEVLARISTSKGAVIFLPSIGWNAQLFQRPHHLARAFARSGYVAIFDSTNVEDDLYGFAEIEPNLFLFRGPARLLRAIPRPVLWTFPYNHHEARRHARPATVVYDWIDDLAVFTDYEARLLTRNHTRALAEADVVLCVARALHEQVLVQRPDALYVPNGVEDAHFAGGVAREPEDPAVTRLRRDGKPIAGYYGALARWFDYDLVAETARRRPDWNFLLIGPDYDGTVRDSAILQCPNVTWIGPRPYPSLPGYLRLFDVATIPFRLDPITMATSPLKLYEYFAGGRPVVATALAECVAYEEVDVVAAPADFARALDVARAKGRRPEVRAHLRAVAAANSWAHRVRQVEGALATHGARTEAAS